ncbi:DUF4345 domain-containing protein [Psychromarinibacter sp. S121]|uniref:DUF4345 domain-containing protein n=1 Tax=Psychromarinibacter sp. S121 TaxID=3415127 RepID=UPI003C7EBB8E
MTLTGFEKFTLGIAGITALSIGAYILAAPHAFYASYGIALGNDASLLSELRAPAAGLAVSGGLMLAGIVRRALAQVAVMLTLIVYTAFPAGRLLGLALDGMPSGGILGALAVEVAIAALCLFAFRRRIGLAPASSTPRALVQ